LKSVYPRHLLYSILRRGFKTLKLKIVFEPSEDGGYTVYVPSLPGCISEGESKEEALTNIKEAIELYLEPLEEDFMTTPNGQVMEVAI